MYPVLCPPSCCNCRLDIPVRDALGYYLFSCRLFSTQGVSTATCLQDLRRKNFDNWPRKWGAGCRSSVFLHLQKAINFQESIILVALLQCCCANQDAIHMHVAKITFYLSALHKCVCKSPVLIVHSSYKNAILSGFAYLLFC